MYKVKTVVNLTGIPRNTLVAWERRYQLFTTHRLENGYRLYSEEEVALLRRLKALVDGGLAISEAVRLVSQEGGLEAAPRRPLWQDLQEPLLHCDRSGAEPFFRRADLLPIERALDEVYRPLLHDLGARWEDGRINVAQEHFASGLIREVLLSVFRQLDSGPVGGPTVVCACLPGEVHDMGLLMVAMRLALRGWRVTWLGADLPLDALCAHLDEHKPRMACLSVLRRGDADRVAESIRMVRARAPAATLVVVGGTGVVNLVDRSTANTWYHPDDGDFYPRLASAAR